jgi:hypothetical protein
MDGDTSPGSDSGIKGDLSKGFTECIPVDLRANQEDSNVLRLRGKVGPRDVDTPQDDPEREMWQRGDIKVFTKDTP